MEKEHKTYLVPNKLAERAGIAAKWISINQIGVYPNLPIKFQIPDKLSSYAPDDASVFNVRPEVILFQPIIRKLVNEANGTFLNVQMFMSTSPANFRAELLKFSRQYRSIIRACLENLQDEVMRAKGEEKEDLQNYITVFYSVECIWHLSEILFVENIPGNVVLPHLLDWVRFHIPTHERNAAQLLSSTSPALESHPEYWNTVVGCLIQGRPEITCALLRLHSDSDSDIFRGVLQTLQTMPVYSIRAGVSLAEHQTQWRHWLIDTQSKLDAHLFLSHAAHSALLPFLVRLAVGEEAAWAQASQEYCSTWYELMAGWLCYTEPAVKGWELGRFGQMCMGRMGGGRVGVRGRDRVLLAAMEGKFELINELQHMTESGWCITHLTDLLYHCGQIEKWQPDLILAAKLRETYLLDYGTLLMGHKSLWQVGISYLDHCLTQGLSAIEMLLPRLQLNSDVRVMKVLREAQKRDMGNVVQSICKVEGIRYLKNGHFGNALNWALKSHDTNFVSYLADRFLIEYTQTGKLQNMDLLMHLGSCMLASDRLIFLGKYCEFHKVYQSNNYKEAANLLMSLMESKLTPKYFWLTLFMDSLPLLECDKLILSSNDTYSLMHCLEEKQNSIPEIANKIDMMRLALSRNLGRALIYEVQEIC